MRRECRTETRSSCLKEKKNQKGHTNGNVQAVSGGQVVVPEQTPQLGKNRSKLEKSLGIHTLLAT